MGGISYVNTTHLMIFFNNVQMQKYIPVKSQHILMTPLNRYEPSGWGNDIYRYTSNTASTMAMLIESFRCLGLILQIELPCCI